MYLVRCLWHDKCWINVNQHKALPQPVSSLLSTICSPLGMHPYNWMSNGNIRQKRKKKINNPDVTSPFPRCLAVSPSATTTSLTSREPTLARLSFLQVLTQTSLQWHRENPFKISSTPPHNTHHPTFPSLLYFLLHLSASDTPHNLFIYLFLVCLLPVECKLLEGRDLCLLGSIAMPPAQTVGTR